MIGNKKTNFLFFITDQMRADHVGYAGNKRIKTPNIDSLAKAGTWWSKFYVTSPTCMSSRASLMTGRMPSLHGVRHNGLPLPLSSVTFVDLLRAEGYDTALIGKSHLQGITTQPPKFSKRVYPSHLKAPPDQFAEAVKSTFSRENYQSEMSELWEADAQHARNIPMPYYGFNKVRFCSGHGDRMSGHYAAWLKDKGFSGGTGIDASLETGKSNAPQVYKPSMPEELYPTSYVMDQTLETLDEFAENDAPFFLQCSFPDPHHPFTPPGKYWDMFDPDDMELPKSFYQPNKDAVPPQRQLWEDFEKGIPSKRWTFPFVSGEDEAREILAKTFGQIAMVDDAIGCILNHLEKKGLAKNTVICFMSDHGDYLGDHGLFLKGPINYQSIIRIPFVWKDPDENTNRGEQKNLGSILDIATSILFRAGLQPANGMQGKDLFTEQRQDDDSLIVELSTTSFPYLGLETLVKVTTLIKQKWRISVWENFEWGELYDLENDPDELTNLWENPTYQNKKSRLLLELIHRVQNNQDTSPHPLTVV